MPPKSLHGEPPIDSPPLPVSCFPWMCITLPFAKLNLILLYPACLTHLFGFPFVMFYSLLMVRTVPSFVFYVKFIKVMCLPFSNHWWNNWMKSNLTSTLLETSPEGSNTMCHLGLLDPGSLQAGLLAHWNGHMEQATEETAWHSWPFLLPPHSTLTLTSSQGATDSLK